MNQASPCALIAEDEPLLAKGLVKTLARLWPALRICAVAHDGFDAIKLAREHLPDIVFTDIRMPECSGLEAVERIVDDWPPDRALPLVVFITAFDRFAIDAFDKAAVDYVLKPVEPERLALTCQRLMSRLQERQATDAGALAPLLALLNSPGQEAPLSLIQASQGATLHVVPIGEVLYFEADDKYVRVVTPDKALLIRTPLRELMPRLDKTQFMQVHRGVVVRTSLIERVVREDTGRLHLHLKGREERLPVSRSHAHVFKPM